MAGPVLGPVDLPSFSEADFRHLISQIEQAIRDLYQTYLPFLYPALDAYYRFLKAVVPDWVIAASYQVISWCWELLEQLINLVINLLVGALVPVAAAVRGLLWSNEAAVYSGEADSLRTAVDHVRVGWSGPGAKAFEIHADRQLERIAALAGACETNSTTMYGVCSAAVVMYVGLATVVGEAVGGTAAGAASTTVIGPGGPAAAAAALGLGILGAVALVGVTVEVVGSIAAGIKAQADNMGTITKSWPEPPGMGYSDGSASDGDRSDWSTEL